MSSGFISESALEERRARRQAEWERVRQPDEPLQRPEETCAKSLFEQLQTNKNKAQEEWEEKHKLKNQIRGIDNDEADFLRQIDHQRLQSELALKREERRELEDLKRQQERLREETEEQRRALELAISKERSIKSAKSGCDTKNKQAKLVLGVVRKRSNSSNVTNEDNSAVKSSKKEQVEEKVDEDKEKNAALLPGLGNYGTSSDEDDS